MASSSKLPPPAREFLRRQETIWHRPIVERFHGWLERRGVALDDLEIAHVEGFLERPGLRTIKDRTRLHYRHMILGYLRWLHVRGIIRFDPDHCFQTTRTKPKLPSPARRFLRNKKARGCRPIVQLLHRWIEERDLSLAKIDPPLLERFLERPFRRPIQHRTMLAYRRQLFRYCEWLRANEYIAFDPQRLLLHPKRLPPIAERFLEALSATLKEGTVGAYRTSLRDFHAWLDRTGLALRTLERGRLSDWFVELHNKKLHPATRRDKILSVRTYLHWLHEQGELQADPDDLVRSRDLPKLPSYLPRPLPPEADRQLQQRLAASGCTYQLGLLLMRRTGLRIGELRALELDCVREDHDGNRYLKVPLGKLDSERLVPLDDATYKLVRKIQRRGRRTRQWLFTTPTGKQTRSIPYNTILRKACDGLDIPDTINTHRLRHTYATELLGAGMSLVGVMRLLGHRDFRMTLRYAAITQDIVREEYHQALAKIESTYRLPASYKASPSSPLKALNDLVRWLQNAFADEDSHAARLLIRRVRRLHSDLRQLLKTKPK